MSATLSTARRSPRQRGPCARALACPARPCSPCASLLPRNLNLTPVAAPCSPRTTLSASQQQSRPACLPTCLLSLPFPRAGLRRRSEHVPLVFTPNFLRCLSNNLSKAGSYLHATAKKCLERITAFAGARGWAGRRARGVGLWGCRGNFCCAPVACESELCPRGTELAPAPGLMTGAGRPEMPCSALHPAFFFLPVCSLLPLTCPPLPPCLRCLPALLQRRQKPARAWR